MTKTAMTLHAQADEEGGQIIWSIGKNPPTKKGEKQKIDFPKGSGEYEVTIRLKDNTGRGIVYNPTTPLYVQEGGECPPDPVLGSSEIPASSVVPGKHSLVFTNLNQKDCKLIYQLNFVDSNNQDVVPPFDPEFKNGGGGGKTPRSAALIAVVTVVAVALVVYVALTSMGKLGQ